ncbi:MAG: ABC transporter permease [Ignisphaera sp.]|nr:ABC transporter permease [Ignisphaera sp.]MCX8168547.1 ABC transporter permease [Ignisphaera sp.]MDW8085133.1 ABC transporter permease [Ignisphaera sp.]
MMEAMYIMMYRQLKRFVRAGSRVVGMVVNNVIWLVFFGLGWAYTLRGPAASALFGGLDYLTFLLPGAFATSIFRASFMSGISVIWDKQFGFLKEVLVAPAPRSLTILCRAV